MTAFTLVLGANTAGVIPLLHFCRVFFSSSLQTHPCFLTSIFPETEEAPGWKPGAHLYHRFYEGTNGSGALWWRGGV